MFKYFFVKVFKDGLSPRVYIKKGIGRTEFFEILSSRNVEYVLLRWWENFPEIPQGEDMDILVKDEHRDLINDLVTFYDNKSEIKADIYTITGVKHGSYTDIPYFQAKLAHTLIDTRVFYRSTYVPCPKLYFASLAYHALFHKGNRSGIPGFKAKGVSKEDDHNYLAILTQLAHEFAIQVDITATGLYEWLKKEGFAPANDTLTKLVENLPELSILEEPLVADTRGGELLTFVIREQMWRHGLINDFVSFLENEYCFDIIDVRMLDPQERSICTMHIRGGKWDKGPFKYSGGTPVAIIVAFDYHPAPLTLEEQSELPKVTNKNNVSAKYAFRERLRSLFLIKGDYNGVHSADNENDAWNYISLLGENYTSKISEEVELRRTRYAAKWSVVKLLSFDQLSKTEVINYNNGVAIKKTFRLGKERFFKRELFAVKNLAKEMSFIPPLLEEGDGYVIIPYIENVLDDLSEKEKKKLLQSKKDEIIHVIKSMYCRGFAYINFTPKNVAITRNGQFFCINFEFLYKYKTTPAKIEDCYEVAGLPQNFQGDCPELFPETSSFNKVWGPYIGRWGKVKFSYSNNPVIVQQ